MEGLVFTAIARPQPYLVSQPGRHLLPVLDPPPPLSPEVGATSLCWVCSCERRGEGEGMRRRQREPPSLTPAEGNGPSVSSPSAKMPWGLHLDSSLGQGGGSMGRRPRSCVCPRLCVCPLLCV